MHQDLRLAFRSLIKSPGFTARRHHHRRARDRGQHRRLQSRQRAPHPAVAVQSAAESRPPLREIHRARAGSNPRLRAGISRLGKTNCAATKASRAFNFGDFNLTGGDMPERIQGAVVTPSLFPLLGVAADQRARLQRERIRRRQRRRRRHERAALAAAFQFRSAARRVAGSDQRPQLHCGRHHAGQVRIPAAAFRRARRDRLPSAPISGSRSPLPNRSSNRAARAATA